MIRRMPVGFVERRSLRPVPRSRFEALYDLAGDAMLWAAVVVIVLGMLEHLFN